MSPWVKVCHFLATGFYSGLARYVPGTVGTFVAMVLFYILAQFVGWVPGIPFAIAVTVLGIFVTEVVCRARVYGDVKDPQPLVIDEFAGYAVNIIGVPVAPLPFLICFFLFRFFDITKIPPIRQLEDLPGGWGIVLDDVLAGVFGLACYHLIIARFLA